MKHVIALDVSKGKSTIAIYNHNRQCEFEGELYHTRVDFNRLHERIDAITELDGQAPEIVFEATGIYSKPVEAFFKDNGYAYIRMNPLEANLQMATMRRHKTDISDAHELAKTHFKSVYAKTRGWDINSSQSHKKGDCAGNLLFS